MDYYRLTIPIPKKPWLWIRFRIGSILLLVAILAILLSWRRDHQQLSAEIDRLRYPYPHYQPSQATGPPNSTSSGDSTSAWCPAAMNGGSEWLLLDYDTSVVPVSIELYENYAPGCVVRIAHAPVFGKEVTLWESKNSPTVASVGGLATLPAANGVKTNRIKVYLDTTSATGWNEIDAVGLIDAQGNKHWAAGAKASSAWGQGSTSIQMQTLSSQPSTINID